MLIAIIISVFFIIFPILVNVQLVYLKQLGKIYFNIKIFGLFNIVKGCVEVKDKEIKLLLNQKEKNIKLAKILSSKNNVKLLFDFNFISTYVFVELGLKNVVKSLFVAHLINSAGSYFSWFFRQNKPYLEIKQDVQLYLDKEIVNVFFKGQILINIVAILSLLFKLLMGKIFNEKN